MIKLSSRPWAGEEIKVKLRLSPGGPNDSLKALDWGVDVYGSDSGSAKFH